MASGAVSDPVTLERDGAVAVLTLNDPGTLNALNAEMFGGLRDRLAEVVDDDSCAVVVLTGAGSSFCSGKDMRVPVDDEQTPTERLAVMRKTWRVLTLLREIQQPVIAAVRGHGVGAGFALTAACDLRVVAPDVKFSAMFAKIGLTPGDLGLSWFRPKLIGLGRATEVFTVGEPIDAETAERWGLANAIAEDPLARARELASRMAGFSFESLRQTKEILNASAEGGSLRAHMELEMRSQAMATFSREHREALARFSRK